MLLVLGRVGDQCCHSEKVRQIWEKKYLKKIRYICLEYLLRHVLLLSFKLVGCFSTILR